MTSNLAVRTEMGSLPVCIKTCKLLYKYYLRLQSFDEHPDSFHSILRAAYKEDSELSPCNKSASCLTNTLKMFKSILKLDSQKLHFRTSLMFLKGVIKKRLYLNWNSLNVLT